MIFEALRQFDDIHTHVVGNQNAVCSLPPEEAIALMRTDICQPYSIMLHPWHVTPQMVEDFTEATGLCAADKRFVAIGECGLDSNCPTPIDLQRQGFVTALLSAKELHKPVVLHIVRQWDEMIRLTRKVFGKGGAHAADAQGCRLIVHGFRKNLPLAQQLVGEGFYLSLGHKYNPDVEKGIAPEKIYHESDDSAN